MTVIAHSYDTLEQAQADYDRFIAWAQERRADASAWQGFSDQDGYWVVALQGGACATVRAFDWSGQRVALSQWQMLEFALHRVEWRLRLRPNGAPACDAPHGCS